MTAGTQQTRHGDGRWAEQGHDEAGLGTLPDEPWPGRTVLNGSRRHVALCIDVALTSLDDIEAVDVLRTADDTFDGDEFDGAVRTLRQIRERLLAAATG